MDDRKKCSGVSLGVPFLSTVKYQQIFEKDRKMRKAIIFLLTLIFSPLFCYADPDKSESDLYNAVHFAENGNDRVVELDKIKHLLDSGSNPNWINTEHKRSESVLSRYVFLVSYEEDPNTVQKGVQAIKLLFDHGAKIQYCDRAILFSPIARNQYEIVKLLLEKGVSATFWPKEKIGGSDYNMTPICVATAEGHEKIIDLLVEYGAKRLSEREAVQLRFVEAAKFESTEVLRQLVEKGAKVNIRNRENETALINVLGRRCNAESYLKVLYLLDLGADVNLEGEGFLGPTLPLHEAIIITSLVLNAKKDLYGEKPFAKRILQELIKKGAYVSGRGDDGKTPLHMAAKYNNFVAAKMLIEGGAKLMDKDSEGKTPLDYAESSEMIKLLKSHGAKEQ